MNILDFLEHTRNHSSDCKEIFAFIDYTLQTVNDGHVDISVAALQTTLGGAYDNVISYVNTMKDALDGLE